MKPNVLIGLPTMSSVHTWLAVTLLSWVAERKVNMAVYPTLSVQPVDNARNEIVEEFLSHPEYTHLLFIDADTIPPQDGLYRLLAHEKDIVTGITPIIEADEKLKEPYRKWNCIGMDDKHLEPNTGLHKIKVCGSSFILISRKVFETLEKPHYRFIYQDDNGKDTCVSEDIYFTAKATGAGFSVYADTDIVCRHYKSFLW